MRVVIETASGPMAGKRLVLEAGQALQVGRTEWADVAFPHDGHMSSVHFLLETDRRACYLQDLGSTNGTYLNGRKITERVALRHGDQIVAGDTPFAVQLDDVGETTDTAAPLPASSAGPVPFAWESPPPDAKREATASGGSPEPREPARRPPLQALKAPPAPYTTEKCESGLTLCRGRIEDLPPADVAVRLSQVYAAYLIVDFKRLGIPRPPELVTPQYLFDWFDPAAAAQVSPVLVGQDDLLGWPALIEQGWGSDGVVCLFSRQEKAVLWEHLRRACRARMQNGQVTAVLGYCWPGVFTALVAHSPPSFVAQLLTGIDAALAELPDLPETWQIYGGPGLPADLDGLGFQQQTREASGIS